MSLPGNGARGLPGTLPGADDPCPQTEHSMTKIKVGDHVAMNTLPDAARFEVLRIEGFLAEVREVGTDYATQTIDVSMVAVKF